MLETRNRLWDDCVFPPLEQPYDKALIQAVQFILNRVPDVSGIVASGTIIRGTPSPSSDLDIYVVRSLPVRQRVQNWFNGVPAEIFVNPYRQVLKYLVREAADFRPITAHMLTTGFVVLERDNAVSDLKVRAAKVLSSPPVPPDFLLTTKRYMAATLFEDAVDVADSRPEACMMIMGRAVPAMLAYGFVKKQLWIPREKDMLVSLDELSPDLAHVAREYYRATSLPDKLRYAAAIAEYTIGTCGFFAWESQPERV